MEKDPNHERLLALGRVAEASSSLEMFLRMVFCTLVDSKYAAIVAGGQSANSLIESSTAVVNVHSDLDEADRAIFKDLLVRASTAYRARNRYIHDTWVSDLNGGFAQIRSKPKSYKLDQQPASTDQVNATADELNACGATILFELSRVFGPKITMEAQLRWEDQLSTMPPEELAAFVTRRQRAAKVSAVSSEPAVDGEPDTNG